MQKVNQERVKFLLAGLANFGAEDEGITRLGYSAEDKAAQEWLLQQIQDLHLEVREDAVGNVFLRRPGNNPALPPVATGSHLDTVIHGGAYDGMCGVIAGLEALYMLQNENLERSIDVIIFRCEESSRFGYATIGSKLLTGKGTPLSLDGQVRSDKSLVEAINAWGGDANAYKCVRLKPGSYSCFVELHIEQGRVLESLGKSIGVVQHIAAPTRLQIRLQGMADHSGATPMGLRKDALVTAAKLILVVEEAGKAESKAGTVATVGMVDVQPNSMNVIPGEVKLWVDVRGIDSESIKRTVQLIQQQATCVAATDGIGCEMKLLVNDAPVALDNTLAQQLATICARKQVSFHLMHSGAGHDAMHMAAIAPTTMIFIPCRQGISHNKAEYAANKDICQGISILAEFIKEQASK